MMLFYPVSLEQGINILRVRLRPDVVRQDSNGNITCYTTREAAQRKASAHVASGRSKQEMFLVAIEVSTPGIMADLRRERPIERAPLATYKADNREIVLLSQVAQDMISKQGRFSLEIVPETEDLYSATYAMAPDWSLGMQGPRK